MLMLNKYLNKNNDLLWTTYEHWYPFVYSIVAVIIYNVFFKTISIQNMDNVLNSVVSFASILIGFLGVIITLLFGQIKTTIVRTLFCLPQYKASLEKYFIRSCQTGFLIIILSICMFFKSEILQLWRMEDGKQEINTIFNSIWLWVLLYFLLTSYRVISITMKVIFLSIEDSNDDESTLDDDQRKKLRDKYSE